MPRIEVRLVGDQASGHAADSALTEIAGEREQAVAVERRVAVAAQDQVALPDDAVTEMPLAEQLVRIRNVGPSTASAA